MRHPPRSRPSDESQSLATRTLRYAALASVTAIVYGSLIPFVYRPVPLAEAWATLLASWQVDLEVGARADLIANAILYLPLGVTVTGLLVATRGGRAAAARLLTVFVLCGLLAAGVEFAQVYVSPRTVSAADVAAELIGSLGGMLAWMGLRARLPRLRAGLAAGGDLALRVTLTLYAIAYLVVALFPFDVLVSPAELRWKLHSGLVDPVLVTAACRGMARCGAKLGAEALAVVPLGVLAAMSRRRSRLAPWRALLAGAAVGLVIESLQFFIASGVSQGLSVVTRAVGVVAGTLLLEGVRRRGTERASRSVRAALAPAMVAYAVLLATVNGWFTGHVSSLPQALARAREVNLLPFYYHYYSSEASAVASVLVHVVMYLPVGVGCWVQAQGRPDAGRPWRLAVATLLGGVTAAVMEAGKLVLSQRHADPSDVLIGAAAAAAAFVTASTLARWSAAARAGVVVIEPRGASDAR